MLPSDIKDKSQLAPDNPAIGKSVSSVLPESSEVEPGTSTNSEKIVPAIDENVAKANVVSKKSSTVFKNSSENEDDKTLPTSSEEYLEAVGNAMQRRRRFVTLNSPGNLRATIDSSASIGESLNGSTSHTDSTASSGSMSSEEENSSRPSTSQRSSHRLDGKGKAKPRATEAVTRIKRELKDVTLNPPPSCSAQAVGDDFFHWKATIEGPENTVYEGGVFVLDIRFPVAYPFRPPRIRFSTRIYHCNIDSRGLICLDVLNEKWSPVLTISKILLSIWVLLCECNPDDPLVMAIADQYNNRRAEHDKIARQWTKKYAKPKKTGIEPTTSTEAVAAQIDGRREGEPKRESDEPTNTAENKEK